MISIPYCYSKFYFIQNCGRKSWNLDLNTYNDLYIKKEVALNNNFNIIFNKIIKEDYVEKEEIIQNFNNTNKILNSKEIDRGLAGSVLMIPAPRVVPQTIEMNTYKSTILSLSKEDLLNLTNLSDDAGTKENNCNIKISDFILNNYKDKCLFKELHHPTNHIYKYLIDEILKKLHVDINISLPSFSQSPLLPQVYPCVYKHLNLKFNYDEKIFKKYCEYQYIHNNGKMLIMNYSIGRSESTKINNVLKDIIKGFDNISLIKSHNNKDVE